jgi:spore cortex biosynthesis protein YabQ
LEQGIEMSLGAQLNLLFAMAIAGCALGFLYDGYRTWLSRGTRNKVIRACVDVLLWLVGSILVFAILQWRSDGMLRIYVFLGLIVGFVLYLKSMSRAFRWIWKILFRIGSALFGFFVLKWWRILSRLWKR